MDCRQAGPYIDPSIISRMVRCLRVVLPISLTSRGMLASSRATLEAAGICWRHEARGGACCGRAVSCPSSTTSERPWGGCTKALVRRHTTMQSIPGGAVSRVPGLCERFNGVRDPKMTLVLTRRMCYSRSGPHPGPSLDFATTSCSSHVRTTPKSAKGIAAA
jgi:hypothetical protein